MTDHIRIADLRTAADQGLLTNDPVKVEPGPLLALIDAAEAARAINHHLDNYGSPDDWYDARHRLRDALARLDFTNDTQHT